MRKVIFGTICVLVGFTAGKHLQELKEYVERKRRQKEWTEFLGAMANLFKVVETTESEEEES